MASGSGRLSGVTSGTLELAVRGAADLRSFASFVGDTASSMHRTAVLLCGDHHLAEDLTLATCAKVFASGRGPHGVGLSSDASSTTPVS